VYTDALVYVPAFVVPAAAAAAGAAAPSWSTEVMLSIDGRMSARTGEGAAPHTAVVDQLELVTPFNLLHSCTNKHKLAWAWGSQIQQPVHTYSC
jgi:hypothetical protein